MRRTTVPPYSQPHHNNGNCFFALVAFVLPPGLTVTVALNIHLLGIN
jgi:hypothetical protein